MYGAPIMAAIKLDHIYKLNQHRIWWRSQNCEIDTPEETKLDNIDLVAMNGASMLNNRNPEFRELSTLRLIQQHNLKT